ncbi:hypothetical protein ACFQ9X_27565 [Catenulispora yoronensis]
MGTGVRAGAIGYARDAGGSDALATFQVGHETYVVPAEAAPTWAAAWTCRCSTSPGSRRPPTAAWPGPRPRCSCASPPV